jgi:hypothetical protein
MKQLFVVLLLGYLASGLYMAKEQSAGGSQPRDVYELYSWRDDKGLWTFSIMSGAISRQRTVEEIFSEKQAIHGVDKLKLKISHLARPSQLVWSDKLIFNGAPVKGSERLAFPPKEIIEDVKR